MTHERKPTNEQRTTPKVEHLELNKESLADLTEQESEQAAGGLVRRPGPCMSCNDSCSPSNARP